jgi:hypothetical protein
VRADPAIDTREVTREDDGVAELDTPYYRRDLALVHHLGFGFHADDCAPGILEFCNRCANAMVWSSSSAAGADSSLDTWSTRVTW